MTAIARRTLFSGLAAGALGLGGATRPAAALPACAAGGRTRTLRIAHLSDIHVMPEHRAAFGFEAALQAALAHGPDMILLGGDMVMDAFAVDAARARAQWDVFDRVMRANVALPVRACLGNHDVWGWGDARRFSREPGYGKRMALDRLRMERPYHAADAGGWHIVTLDSIHRIEGDGYTARLDEEQFAWLQADLAAQPAGRPILVLSHVPILAACAFFDGDNERYGRWTVPGGWMHTDARRLKDLFARHGGVKLCLSGHTHLADRVDYLGVAYRCNGAVCAGWWGGPCQEFGNSYAIVDLFDDGSFDNRRLEFAWQA